MKNQILLVLIFILSVISLKAQDYKYYPYNWASQDVRDTCIKYKEYKKGINYMDEMIADEFMPELLSIYYQCRGDIKIASGDTLNGITDYDKCIDYEPNNPEMYYFKAKVYTIKGNYNKAINIMNESFKKAKNKQDAYYYIGLIKMEQKDYSDAILNLEKGNPWFGYDKLILAYNLSGKNNKGIMFFSNLIDTVPQDDDLYKKFYYYRSQLSENISDTISAKKDMDKFYSLINSRHYSNAIDFEFKKEWENALTEINMALKILPYNYKYRFYKAKYLIKLNKYKNAIFELDTAIMYKPQYADAYFYRGNAKMKEEKYDEAILDYKKYQELKPEKSYGYGKIADIYRNQEKYQKALEYIDKAISIEPEYSYHYYIKARIFFAKGEIDNSIKYHTIYQNNETGCLGYFSIAEIYFYKGNYIKADIFINKAIENKETGMDVFFAQMKSDIYCKKKDYKQALAIAMDVPKLTDKHYNSIINTCIVISNVFLGNKNQVISAVEIIRKHALSNKELNVV